MIRPAIAGPAISMTWKLSRLSAMPAASCPGASSRGTKVCLAGLLTALSADWTATSPYSSQTRRIPANAWAASAADTTARQQVVISTSLRRSTASASEPPSSPMVSIGTIRAMPMAPTASVERVISNT